MHYVKEKNIIAHCPLYVLPADLRPHQPVTEQSTGSVHMKPNTTDRQGDSRTQQPVAKLRSRKQTSKYSSRRLSKEPLPVLFEEEEEKDDVSSQDSPKIGTPEPQQPSSHNENTDGDSPTLFSHALVNEPLHSRNASLASTVFSGVENHSGTNTPTSPITPPKVNHKVISTNVQIDGLLVSTNALPSIIPACFTTPHGTMKTDLPGGWLETRDHHEGSIYEFFPEASPDKLTRDTSAEFLEDIVSSFLSKKLSGPFCWVEIGSHQYMTIWNYACGYFNPSSHRGFKILKEDLCYDKSKSDQRTALPREPSGDTGKIGDETTTSKGERDPVASNSVDLHEDCALSKTTQNEQGEGHRLAHVSAGRLQKENAPKEESGDALIHQSTADPRLASPQDLGKEAQPISAAPKATQIYVGHPRPLLLEKTKKQKNVRDGNTLDNTTDCGKSSGNTQDEETSNAKSSCIFSDETTIQYCNLHSDPTYDLSHVFPWLISSKDERVIDEPKAALSNMPAEVDSSPSIQEDSNKEEISHNSSDPESSRVSTGQAPETPYCNLQAESAHGLAHVFPWLARSQDAQEEDESKAGSSSDVPAENEMSATPYCNLQDDATQDLSHVFPWLKSDQDVLIKDEPIACLASVPTSPTSDVPIEDGASATPYCNLQAESTHGLSHVFPWLRSDQDIQIKDEPEAGLSSVFNGDETSVSPYCNLRAEKTNNLAHVFPWLTSDQDEQVKDKPEPRLSCVPSEDDPSVSTPDVLNNARETSSDAQNVSNSEETGHNLSHVFPWLMVGRDEEVEVKPEAEEFFLPIDNDSSVSGEDDTSEHGEIECGSSHAFVDYPLAKSHEEDDEPEAGPPSENDSSISTEHDSDHEESRYPLFHVFVGHKWLAPQDIDNHKSCGGEDVDPCLANDSENLPVPVEDCSNPIPTGMSILQKNCIQQARDVDAVMHPTGGVSICQSVEGNNMILSEVHATVAAEVFHHFPTVNNQQLVVYSGATDALIRIHGLQRGQIELDGISPALYSIRQLLATKRSTVNNINNEDCNSIDAIENSTRREIVLRTFFWENSAETKAAEFNRLIGTVENSGRRQVILRSIVSKNTVAIKVVEFMVAKKYGTAMTQGENSNLAPQVTEGSAKEVVGSGESSYIRSDPHSNTLAEEEANSAHAFFLVILYILILWIFW